jgi:threonine dehydrogenase-like Zn-dependent dehydrogenase
MRALVWTAPRELVIRDVPEPQAGPGEVLVAVGAAGICGSELSGYLGQSSIRKPPLIMGHEAAGRIAADADVALGDGTPTRAGTRVTFNPLWTCGECDRCQAGLQSVCRNRQLIGAHRPGAYAPLVAVPAAQCFPLPDGVSETAGALTEPLACAVRAVARSGAQPGDALLVLGAGPIGLCCVAAARAAGIERILISDSASSRLEMAQRWGAEATANARVDDVVARAGEYMPGGVPYAIDAVGTGATRTQALRAVAPGGRAVFIGLHDEESTLHFNYLVRQEIDIAGTFAYTSRDFARALDMIVSGQVAPAPDWLEERDLADGPAAFEELLAGTARAAKIVLRVG